MRAPLFILVLLAITCIGIVTHTLRAGFRPGATASATSAMSFSSTPKTDFETKVKPILQARCQPCHFQGGKVYDKMPFDNPETVIRLGEKMFTRVKDREEQRVIREFLAQP